jgi:hypothetical protein
MHDRMPATNEVGRGRPTRLIAALIRLFPAPWRDRYGDEFAALLEGTPLDARALFDVLVAAVDARLDPTGPRRRWPLMIERTRFSELVVLAAWVLFVVAGLGFQRMTEGAPFGPIAAADPVVGVPLAALVAAAVVSLLAVLVAGVPIAAAIALVAIRSGRRDLLGLLGVPPIALAVWVALTALILAAAGPNVAGAARVALFVLWVGAFVVAAVASTVAVSAAALRAEVDGDLYVRARTPAIVTATGIAVGAVAVATWGVGLLADHADAFWGSDGLVSTSTAFSWLGILVAMAVAAGVAARAAARIRAMPRA